MPTAYTSSVNQQVGATDERINYCRSPRGISAGSWGVWAGASGLVTITSNVADGPTSDLTTCASLAATLASGYTTFLAGTGDTSSSNLSVSSLYSTGAQPCTPGGKVAVSVWVKTGSVPSGSYLRAKMTFRDGNGTHLTSLYGSNVTPTASWQLITAVFTAPAGAEWGSCAVTWEALTASTPYAWKLTGWITSNDATAPTFFDALTPGARSGTLNGATVAYSPSPLTTAITTSIAKAAQHRSLTDTALRIQETVPPYLQGATDAHAVFIAAGNEIDRVDSAIEELLGTEGTPGELFPRHSVSLLGEWEAMLNIPTEPRKTTLERARTVTAVLQTLKSADSGTAWWSAMNTLIGANGWGYRVNGQTITLYLPYPKPLLAPPSGSTPTAAGTGSALSAGSYYYAVTAYDGYGETDPLTLTASALTVTAGQTVSLSWTAPTQGTPTGYYIYRGTSLTGMKRLVTTTSITGTTFQDTGYNNTGAIMPTASSTTPWMTTEVLRLARQLTPAHISIAQDYGSGFILGSSKLDYGVL